LAGSAGTFMMRETRHSACENQRMCTPISFPDPIDASETENLILDENSACQPDGSTTVIVLAPTRRSIAHIRDRLVHRRPIHTYLLTQLRFLSRRRGHNKRPSALGLAAHQSFWDTMSRCTAFVYCWHLGSVVLAFSLVCRRNKSTAPST
jgi:hypothetical protein